jgi:hypothetical protein
MMMMRMTMMTVMTMMMVSGAGLVMVRSGWGLGEHNHWSKYTNWETDARVPLMVRVPWKPLAMGRRTSAIVEHVDLSVSTEHKCGDRNPALTENYVELQRFESLADWLTFVPDRTGTPRSQSSQGSQWTQLSSPLTVQAGQV